MSAGKADLKFQPVWPLNYIEPMHYMRAAKARAKVCEIKFGWHKFIIFGESYLQHCCAGKNEKIFARVKVCLLRDNYFQLCLLKYLSPFRTGSLTISVGDLSLGSNSDRWISQPDLRHELAKSGYMYVFLLIYIVDQRDEWWSSTLQII